jgi:hypothetical protein
VLALWIDLGGFHRHNNSDSLLPVLVSLYRWTPFFWDQNRVGMLVPLLALPLRHPMDNLLFQGWLVLWAALALPFLLTRYVMRSPQWPVAGTLAAAIWVFMSSPWWLFNSSFGQLHYAVGLTLGLGSLLVVEAAAAASKFQGGRLAAALALMLLASWANTSTCIILLPLVVLRRLVAPGEGGRIATRWAWLVRAVDRETALALVLALLGLASCVGHRLLVTVAADPFGEGLVPVYRWPAAWAAQAWNVWQEAGEPCWPGLLALAVIAALVYLPPASRRFLPQSLRAGLVLAGAGTVYGLFVGTTGWIEANFYSARYWIPVIYFFEAALGVVIAMPLAAFLKPRIAALLHPAAAVTLMVAVALAQGLPSRARARAEVDQIGLPGVSITHRTSEILQEHATHLVGTYWQVWASVFHANLVLHERGEDHLVWGVVHRCTPTWPFWGKMAPEELRVAVLTDGRQPDPLVDKVLPAFFPPLEVVSKGSTLWNLRARETILLARKPVSAGEPLIASWYGGFHPALEGSQGPVRACGGSGKLNLTNPTQAPQVVALRMGLMACGSRPCHLWIEGSLFHSEMELTSVPLYFQRVVTVPPGRHVLHFRCDGAPASISSADMPIVFLAGEFSVHETDPPVEPGSS